MSAEDYILRLALLVPLGAYLLRKRREREREHEASNRLALKRLPSDWTGKAIDAGSLFSATAEVRRNPAAASRSPAHQAHYKRAFLALARVSVEQLNYFNPFRAARH